jgi:hypothetical protein
VDGEAAMPWCKTFRIVWPFSSTVELFVLRKGSGIHQVWVVCLGLYRFNKKPAEGGLRVVRSSNSIYLLWDTSL